MQVITEVVDLTHGSDSGTLVWRRLTALQFTPAQTPKGVYIHDKNGKTLTEIDELDLKHKIIYEDKTAGKLYMENPDCPQTEQQIYISVKHRIDAIMQGDLKLSSVESKYLPDVQDIKTFIFRIDTDTPELRKAVEECLQKLREAFPGYSFTARYGGG